MASQASAELTGIDDADGDGDGDADSDVDIDANGFTDPEASQGGDGVELFIAAMK